MEFICITLLSNVKKSWNGIWDGENDQETTDLAATGNEDSLYTIQQKRLTNKKRRGKPRERKIITNCTICQKEVENKIEKESGVEPPTKKRKLVKWLKNPLQSLSDLKRFEGAALKTRLEEIIASGQLYIEKCCRIFSGDQGSFGSAFLNFSWSKTAVNEAVKDPKKFNGVQSEDLVTTERTKMKNYNFPNCKCGEEEKEKCFHKFRKDEGTTSYNNIGKVVQMAGGKGLNHIGVDFDEYPKDTRGLRAIARHFMAKMLEISAAYFFMTLSLWVRDDDTKKPYMHTVVLQVFTKEKEAVLIDPNEAVHNKDGRTGKWLDDNFRNGTSPRKQLPKFLEELFGIKELHFGAATIMDDNSKRFNGKAEPNELFKQHYAG